MGLDMYLYRETYIGNKYKDKKDRIKLKNANNLKINEEKISYITETVMDWRKANHIHKWFVDNVQDGNDDCEKYDVSQEQLKDLLELVTKVSENHNLAPNLLPTQSGFFFGSEEYDDYYFENTLNTKIELEKILKEGGDTFYYQSSW